LYFVADLDSTTRIYKYDFTTEVLSYITSDEQVVTWPMVQADNKRLTLIYFLYAQQDHKINGISIIC
jgi:hypothetical protein